MKMYDLVTYYIQKPERIYIAPSRLFEIYNKSDLVAELSDHIFDKSYTAALAVADLDSAIGLLPAAYDKESKFLMSKKTFYTNIVNLTDVNNLPVVQREGNKFIVRGFEVVFSDQVAANAIYFGSFKRGMAGNLGVDIKVEKQRNLRYNSYDFLGWGVFDCKPAQTGCIVKIASDIAA